MKRFNYYLLKKGDMQVEKVCFRFYCYSLPTSEVKIIRRRKSVECPNLKEEENGEKHTENISDQRRVNAVNIQMISKNLYEQLFKETVPTSIDTKTLKSCLTSLEKHGIDIRKVDPVPDVELKLPKLEGKDVVEHFYNIGEKQSAPYRDLLKSLAKCKPPPMPKKWAKKAGWCKYRDGKVQPVPCPPDDAIILDVEVLMSAGQRPTLACAMSTDAWYGWVSEPVANNKPHEYFDTINYEDLIPLESDGLEPSGDLCRPRIVIGHNVSYDRAKIKEQYWLNKTGVRFMDTMSMHTCVSGVTSYQRAVLKTKDKEPVPGDEDWMEISSLNSLTEVHKLYCGVPINKETRDIFVEGAMEDVHKNFDKLMQYCAGDVIATYNVLRELLPLFLERFPHPVTLAGMLELGSAYLPVNSNWLQYLDSSETVFEDLKLESRQLLSQKADETCRLMENDAYKNDLWMWDQDWSAQNLKLKKGTVKSSKKNQKDCIENFAEETLQKNGIAEEKVASDKNEIPNSKQFDVLCEEYLETKEYNPEIDKSRMEIFNKTFAYLYDIGKLLPVKRPYLAGYPAWYRKLCTKPEKDPDWEPGANNITTSMQITPKLLRLSWEGYPLHYIKGEGWGFLVPFSRRQSCETDEPVVPLQELLKTCPLKHCKEGVNAENYVLPKVVEVIIDNGTEPFMREFDSHLAGFYSVDASLENGWTDLEDLARRQYYARKKLDEQAKANQYHGLGVWCGVEIQGCCHFLRLPHKDGPKYKVGNPLAKDFLDMFSQNVLSAQGDIAEKVLTFGRMMSYWRNNRSRILSQGVVWLPRPLLPEGLRHQAGACGALVPQLVVAGTLTRRASEPTWMTASNAHKERIGSELRAMVQAPPGFKFVGADVDSQELWIAALLGDSKSGLIGGSAFGWGVVAGDKRRGSDLHSLAARQAGVSRDHAKCINYARIYGAGQNFAERLLKQFNPSMTMSEAKSKAAKMFSSTKGRRVYVLKRKYMEGLMDKDLEDQVVEMTSYQAMRLAKMSSQRLEDMFERPKWVGGTESDMFNKLEEIADSEAPCTAFLEGRLSRALELARGRWGGTRLNWVVQSAAADFLHLMLVSMTHLAPEARFCLSFHDEVRYLVPDKYKYETALALQITNLLTRAFCSQRVGINDLPLSVAFFTSVEVDQVLRKESNLCCTTPSNPHGLEKGYGIPNGESLTIFDVLNKCKNKDVESYVVVFFYIYITYLILRTFKN